MKQEKDYVKFKEDPKGFFHIYVDKKKDEIVVEHYESVKKEDSKVTATGKVNKKYRGDDAQKLYRRVLADDVVSLMDHASYLGYELGKAEVALRNNLDYTQDEGVVL